MSHTVASILRSISTQHPTRFKTVQMFFHAIYQSSDQNDHSKIVFKQKNSKENKKNSLNIVGNRSFPRSRKR